MGQINNILGNTLLESGFFPPCRAATTAAITLSGLQTIDGVALLAGDRVLVKNQTDTTLNGIYAAASGNWVRTTDAQSNTQFFQGMAVMIATGNTWAGAIFQCTCTDDPVAIGTSHITFGQALTFQSVTNPHDFPTRAVAAATIIPSSVTYLRTAGYAVIGDGGDTLYDKASGSTIGGFQSADGQWWQIAKWWHVTPQMFGAKADGVTDDTTAFQNAIDLINGHFGNSGTVDVPTGDYLCISGITLKGSVRLVGAGVNGSRINSINYNLATVIVCDALCSYASIENISVYGYLNAAATHNTVTIQNNALVICRDCVFYGGVSGLNTAGVDCYFENCAFDGYGFNVLSTGANWYVRCKIDTAVASGATAGFHQGAYFTTGVAENHFTQCDFSGSYTNSIEIADGGQVSALTVFEGCVFSKPIVITSANVSMFSGGEIGSSVTVGTNPTIINGCAAVSGAIVVSGAGKVVSGCYNIS